MKRLSSFSLIVIILLFSVACNEKEAKSIDTRSLVLNTAGEGKCAEAEGALNKSGLEGHDLSAALLTVARCYDKKEQRRNAEEYYSRFLDSGADLEPKERMEALERLARFAFSRNDAAAAEKYALQAEELGDPSTALLMLRSAILSRNKNFAAAIPLLEKILQAEPDNQDALTGLASAYTGIREPDKARELLRTFLDRKPSPGPALDLFLSLASQAGDIEDGEKILGKLMEREPAAELPAVLLSELYLAAGDAEKAVRSLRSFLEKNPETPAVRLRLAGMLSGQGQHDAALELLDQVQRQSGEVKLARAGVLMRAGRLDEAISALKSVIDDPRDRDQTQEARTRLAELYMQMGLPKEAENQAGALIAAYPERMENFALRGRIRMNTRDFAGAVEDFSVVAEALPQDHQVGLALAEAYNAAGNTKAAEDAITRILSRAPQFGPAYIALTNLYLARGMQDAALLTLNIGQGAAPNDINIPLFASSLLANNKRYSEAVKILEPLTENPDMHVSETAFLRLAAIYGAQKNSAKALATYDRALKKNPSSTMVAEGRVRFQLASKQEKAAMAFAEKRMKERPTDPTAAFIVGECALANRDAQKAEQAYKRALELAPNWEQPLLFLIRIYSATKQTDKAIKLCRDVAAKNPNNVNAEMYLAMLLEQTGKFDQAEEQYRKIIATKPEYLAAANNLAFLLTRHKSTPERLAEAETLAGKAAAGEAPQPLDTLGWVQHLRGNPEAAEANLRKSLALQEKNAFARYHLAAVLAAAPDKDKKAEALNLLKALAADKSFPLRREAEKLQKTLTAKNEKKR
ncbi:MAG: tetratricopeptide repeat protein [Desulfovibrio sp.]|nr:tetratricopeptide repeat protein [Desulfovibrio sp.]